MARENSAVVVSCVVWSVECWCRVMVLAKTGENVPYSKTQNVTTGTPRWQHHPPYTLHDLQRYSVCTSNARKAHPATTAPRRFSRRESGKRMASGMMEVQEELAYPGFAVADPVDCVSPGLLRHVFKNKVSYISSVYVHISSPDHIYALGRVQTIISQQ